MVDTTLIAQRVIVVGLAAMIASLLGCADTTPPLYAWGRYEDVLFETFLKPGESPAAHASILREDIAKAHAEGQAVPPGVHAQLGYLYHIQGDDIAAKTEFELEKQRFPEATVMINRLLGQVGKQ